MKAFKSTYIVVFQSLLDCGKCSLSFSNVTFNQVLKKAKFVCPEDYFIREIKVLFV